MVNLPPYSLLPLAGEGTWCVKRTLPFNADQRFHARDLAREAGVVGRVDHFADILVRAWRFLGNPAHRRAAYQYPVPGEIVHYMPPVPVAQRLMAAHRAPRTVAGGAEGDLHAGFRPGENIGRSAHAAADQHRLAGIAQLARQVGMPRAEGARGALAVHVEVFCAP